MKLASLDDGSLDGALLVVDRELRTAVRAGHISTSMQQAIDRWHEVASELAELYEQLNARRVQQAFELDVHQLAAPLPRAYQFLDGSCYPEHIRAVRLARGAQLPAGFGETPLLYQGHSDHFLGPTRPIRFAEDEALGIDFEAEVIAVTDHVRQGTDAFAASKHVILLGLLNDTSLRHLITAELPRGFGFMQGKPNRTMGPVFVTPDELPSAWDGRTLSGTYIAEVRGNIVGTLNPGLGADFGYGDLIAHASRTRGLCAGTIVGLGAIAAPPGESSRGCGCLAELRAREQLEHGAAKTPYLSFGDEVRLEMFDSLGRSIFGAIEQRIERL